MPGLHSKMLEHYKRQHYLDELKRFGVSENVAGQSIQDLDNDELKELLVLACFKYMESERSNWF